MIVTTLNMQRALEKMYSSSMKLMQAELTCCVREINALKSRVEKLENEVKALEEKSRE